MVYVYNYITSNVVLNVVLGFNYNHLTSKKYVLNLAKNVLGT